MREPLFTDSWSGPLPRHTWDLIRARNVRALRTRIRDSLTVAVLCDGIDTATEDAALLKALEWLCALEWAKGEAP